MEKWSNEKAWEWYGSRPWIRGFNGYPSNCVNRTAMWQKYNHKEVFDEIEYEFQLAKETGFNAVRAIMMFEVWLYEHDSYMANVEEYVTLADKYGIKVMITIGNDCLVPKDFYKFSLGEQHVDWGYHSGIKRGQHSSTHTETGYMLPDDEEYTDKFYQMIAELAEKYAKDERVEIWDIWNEIGNNRRGMTSVPMMKKAFEIVRSFHPIQPLTADIWHFCEKESDILEQEKIALELSDVITFHFYGSYTDMVKEIDFLKTYDRPLINNEWLNRITHNNVDEIFPLFYLEKIGSYHWGLIQGFSQTYEPWGCYFEDIKNPNYNGENDYTKLQHDLYRFNGLPYRAKEIEIIKQFSRLADEKFSAKK